MKCWGTHESGSACQRIRVFAYADLPARPDLTEIQSILPNYPVIAELSAAGGYRKEIAEFLVYACDLDMIGQLEPDSEAREAAYRGAAIYVRIAAEMFLARCILRRKVGHWGKPGGMVRAMRREQVRTIKLRTDRATLADNFQWIFDFGNVAAHPRVSDPRLQRIRERFPATHGTVTRALSYLNTASKEVYWSR